MKSLLAALVLWLFASAVLAGPLHDGAAAYERGDYATALRLLRPFADQGDANAESILGFMYYNGQGVPQDYDEAVKWYRQAADQGNAVAQYNLGVMYAEGQGNLRYMFAEGEGVPQDYGEAAKWYRRAADQGHAGAQYNLGVMYDIGQGVPQDYAEAAKWYRLAAEEGNAGAQYNLGLSYGIGEGVPQDDVQAYAWFNLAAAQGNSEAARMRDAARDSMTGAQVAEAQRLSRQFAKLAAQDKDGDKEPTSSGTGTGFLVTTEGHGLTNKHVIHGCRKVTANIVNVERDVTVAAVDDANDLALLKLAGTYDGVAEFSERRSANLGEAVTIAGYPLRGLLSDDLNVTTGTVSALAGPQNDARLLQVSAPVQPGNSGGPLLDNGGNVIGVVVSKLDAVKAAEVTGDIPQNVNFAIKAVVARAFLDIHGVAYTTVDSRNPISTETIAKRARAFTVPITCWR